MSKIVVVNRFEWLSRTDAIQRLVLLGLCAANAVVFNWSYAHVETDLFLSLGYIYDPPRAVYIAWGYAAVLVPAMWMPLRMSKPSDLGYWLLYGTVLVPTMFLPFHVITTPDHEILWLTVMLFANFALMGALLSPPSVIRIPVLRVSASAFRIGLLLGVVLLTVVVVTTPSFTLDLSLVGIYVRRFAARSVLSEGSWRGYAVAALATGFAPVAIGYGLATKRFLFAIAGTTALLTIFALNGTKSSLLTPVFLIAIVISIRWFRGQLGILIVAGFLTAVASSAMLYRTTGVGILSHSVTRRIIAEKGLSTAQYWEVYRDRLVLMKDSGLMRVLGLPRARAKSFEIGERLGAAKDANANTNAWAANQANFGYTGFLLTTLLVVIVFRSIDALCVWRSREVFIIAAGFFAMIIGEMALETTILNGGAAVTLVLLYALRGTYREGDHMFPQSRMRLVADGAS